MLLIERSSMRWMRGASLGAGELDSLQDLPIVRAIARSQILDVIDSHSSVEVRPNRAGVWRWRPGSS